MLEPISAGVFRVTFNSTLSTLEKLSFKPSRFVRDFQQMLLSSGLQDMGFSGSKFTWSNNRRDIAYVAARLGRAL